MLERALLLSSDIELNKKLLYNMGNCYFAMEKFDRAIAIYEQALHLDPYYEDAKTAIEEVNEAKAAQGG
jgi:tetratricopeptide (TPR) repeat protein